MDIRTGGRKNRKNKDQTLNYSYTVSRRKKKKGISTGGGKEKGPASMDHQDTADS